MSAPAPIPPEGRGGPQRIPRPDDWRPGRPAPWADLDDRTLTLDRLVSVLDGRSPSGIRGRPRGDERASGVLVALYDDPVDGAHVVLTRRASHLTSHTHEVSFPGGRHDPDDADLWATALREAAEEVALDPSLPRLVGRLNVHVHEVVAGEDIQCVLSLPLVIGVEIPRYAGHFNHAQPSATPYTPHQING